MYEYHSEVKKLIDKVVDKNQDILNKVIDLVGKTIINDKIIHISISHSDYYAIAFAILEKK